MSRWRYPALAFCTGAAVTVYEFAAPSLLRGWFGQTIYVWANVIGVILAALALGYGLGGRYADRTTGERPLACVVAFAGVYGLLVAWLGPAFASWLAGPEEYTQDTALRAFIGQSLAASLVLFAPPLTALGMATPLLVKRAAGQREVGNAAGTIFSIGTFGSITGIYATTFLFLEWWGVRLTIALAGAFLSVLAAGLFWRQGRRVAAAGCIAVLGLAWLGKDPPWDELPPEDAELELAIESPYQLIRVVRRPDGAKWLAFDEGMGTYHSIDVGGERKWTDAYYDAFAHLPEWVERRGAGEEAFTDERPFRVAIVGNAAGTMCDLLLLHNDDVPMAIDAVEIDPRVTEAARAAMGLEDRPAVNLYHGDGRTFLRAQPEGEYDAVVLDAYARQVSIPPGLATEEFFALCRDRLRPGGMLFVNLGALRPGGRLVRVVADTIGAGFGDPVFRAPIEGSTNVLLVCARDRVAPPPPPGSQLGIRESFGRHVQGSGDLVLTDDFCPVESLTAKDLLLE